MKKILIAVALLCVPLSTWAFTNPGTPMGYVNDFAHVLSSSDIQTMNSQLSAFKSSTGDEIAVVTVPTIGTDETIETYAVKLFEAWGIGAKGNDNGVLILVAVNDHQARIEVGYGLEGDVTDLQANNIIQKVMIPAFKNSDYPTGIRGAVDAVTGIISGSEDADQYKDTSSSNITNALHGINPGILIFIGFFVLSTLGRILGKSKSWWLGGLLGAGAGAVIGLIWGFVSAGIISIVILTILGLLFDFIVSRRPPGSSGRGGGVLPFFGGFGGSGRGGWGGGGGGGFGGFGGGMSGGGGASGRW